MYSQIIGNLGCCRVPYEDALLDTQFGVLQNELMQPHKQGTLVGPLSQSPLVSSTKEVKSKRVNAALWNRDLTKC